MATPIVLDGPLRGLLTAVLEALDIPHPATVGDAQEYRLLLAERAMHAKLALRYVLDESLPVPADIVWEAEHLRQRLADHPPTGYQHYHPVGGGE